MILNLSYKYGRGHMTVDLDKFLPASLAQWRKLVRVMVDSYPDPREDVKAYLCKRYEDAKWDIKVLGGTITAAQMVDSPAAEEVRRLMAWRSACKKGTDAYKELSAKIRDKTAKGKGARAKIRSAEAQIRALQNYIDKYPDYMRLLTQ